MKNVYSNPRGTSDIIPDEIPLWKFIEGKVRNILDSYNYKEIRTPYFEETQLFARSMGQTSDVVLKQMLNLASQKSADDGIMELSGLSLRPENTASVVRAYIQYGMKMKESLSKLYYIGPMFRGERPQKGRLRQFHQIGVEAIGENSCNPYLDAEVISMAVNLLNSLGLNNFKLKINTLGSSEDKDKFSLFLRDRLKSRLNDLCPDCINRFERNVFRILDCKNKDCKQIVSEIEFDYSYLSKESKDYYDAVKNILTSMNIVFEEAVNLVRGLDYYTHTVFEISDSSLGSQDALGAGGRYNSLVSQLGGPEVDAIGFALGIERLILAMPEKKDIVAESLDCFIIIFDENGLKKGFNLCNYIRNESQYKFSCDISYKFNSIKSQMKMANKLNAKAVMIIGDDELKNEYVTFKDMETGNQEKIEIKNNNYSSVINILKRKV